jgi:hypothetical protein
MVHQIQHLTQHLQVLLSTAGTIARFKSGGGLEIRITESAMVVIGGSGSYTI